MEINERRIGKSAGEVWWRGKKSGVGNGFRGRGGVRMVVVDVARRTVQEEPGNVSVSVSWGGGRFLFDLVVYCRPSHELLITLMHRILEK